jgi:hypothetical protein
VWPVGGRPKDFADAYLPQCAIRVPEQTEVVQLAGYAGRACAEFEARVQAFVDLRTDWYAGEQQILAIRDALWPALLHHERLGASVTTVVASEARPRARPLLRADRRGGLPLLRGRLVGAAAVEHQRRARRVTSMIINQPRRC